MKRTKKAYIPYCPGIETAEGELNKGNLMLWDGKPSVPYLEIEITVIHHEENYAHTRNEVSFAEKAASLSFNVPRKFLGKD